MGTRSRQRREARLAAADRSRKRPWRTVGRGSRRAERICRRVGSPDADPGRTAGDEAGDRRNGLEHGTADATLQRPAAVLPRGPGRRRDGDSGRGALRLSRRRHARLLHEGRIDSVDVRYQSLIRHRERASRRPAAASKALAPSSPTAWCSSMPATEASSIARGMCSSRSVLISRSNRSDRSNRSELQMKRVFVLGSLVMLGALSATVAALQQPARQGGARGATPPPFGQEKPSVDALMVEKLKDNLFVCEAAAETPPRSSRLPASSWSTPSCRDGDNRLFRR